METRNISLTLDRAKEWYNSGSADLREVALQAYTEKELRTPEWQNIKTFEDAWKALRGLTSTDIDNVTFQLNHTCPFGPHMFAMWKLDIIRKALNKGWKPSLVKGEVYYPYVKFYPAGKGAKEAAESNGWVVKETFKADGEKYSLVGGACDPCCFDGLGSFGYGFGDAFTDLGLLGCKSAEIAKHMSRYFAKEIFEACYAQHVGTYRWI